MIAVMFAANTVYDQVLGMRVCKDGYYGDFPVDERGCWKCSGPRPSTTYCSANETVAYRPAFTRSFVIKESYEERYFDMWVPFRAFPVYCSFDGYMVDGIFTGENTVRCVAPDDVATFTKLSLSTDPENLRQVTVAISRFYRTRTMFYPLLSALIIMYIIYGYCLWKPNSRVYH